MGGKTSDFATSYCAAIKRFRYGIFVLWFAITLAGAKWGTKFTAATTSQYTSAYDSPSAVAQRKISHYFPKTKKAVAVSVLLSQSSEQLAVPFLDAIKDVELDFYTAVSEKYGYSVTAETGKVSFIRDVSSYWIFQEYFSATELAESLVAGNDALMSVTYDNTAGDDKIDSLVDFVDKTTKDLLQQHGLAGSIKYGVTGIDSFANDILDGVAEDLHFMDEAVLPLAMLILSCIIRSVTLMLIPVLNILVTILAEFLVMYPVALNMEVVSFTPSLMMSITIAMSIDYSLFLLSRFMEEIEKGRSVEEAIPYMIDGAGHTILVSGGTLICCFLGMLIFPMAMLQSVGVGASVTLFFALSVNLTLTPAILYSIGKELVTGQNYLEKCWGRMYYCLCGGQKGGVMGINGGDGGDDVASLKSLETGNTLLDTPLMEEDSSMQEVLGDTDDHRMIGGQSTSVGEALQISNKSLSNFSFGDAGTNFGDDEEHDEEFARDLAMSKSLWYRLAWFLLNPWPGGVCVLLLTCALSAPICMHALDVDISISFDMSVPDGSATYNTFKDIEAGFGAGAVFPYQLLFLPKSNASSSSSDSYNPCQGAVYPPESPSLCSLAGAAGKFSDGNTECSDGFMCPTVFDAMTAALQTLEDNGKPHSDLADLVGITSLNLGSPVTYANYVTAIEHEYAGNGALNSFDRSILLLYEGFCDATNGTTTTSATSTTTPDTTATTTTHAVNLCAASYVTVMLAKDPYSMDGVKWLEEARKTLDDLSGADGALFDFYLGYGSSMTYDVTNDVYDSFPLIVVVTLSTVFVLMGVAFKSLVAPIRSVLTLALTVAFVYGLLVLVYQKGAFAFLGLRCLDNAHAVSWLPPVMSFSIIVGLGLDYDVFLISRVYEYRLEGNTDHAAAVKGICSTGYIITAAGLIMAVAFGGLMTSEELLLNQTSFLLVFAVLLDTFVVRTLCVPALLGITDTLSWWPSKMPPATKSISL